MKPKEFLRLLERDKRCVHCGSTGDDLIPHHRANRGMGGAGKDSPHNRPSNLLLLCSEANFLLEFDAKFAERGRFFGWKLSKFVVPAEFPAYDSYSATWFYLTDDWSRVEIHNFGKGMLGEDRESV